MNDDDDVDPFNKGKTKKEARKIKYNWCLTVQISECLHSPLRILARFWHTDPDAQSAVTQDTA